MPDPKRNSGPEDAIEPPVLRRKNEKITKSKEPKLTRDDGRELHELRPLFMKCGIITKAQGSVYMEMGETKLIAAIYGPREIVKREDFSLRGKVNCEFKYMPFSRKNYCNHRPELEEKVISKCISESLEGVILLEKFPKAKVDIAIQVIQDDGSCLSLALTAASVALVDAQVEIRDLVIGCTIRCLEGRPGTEGGQEEEDAEILVDPTKKEEYGPQSSYATGAGLYLAILPSLSQISALTQYGKIDPSRTQDCIEKCWEACLRLATGVKTILKSEADDVR